MSRKLLLAQAAFLTPLVIHLESQEVRMERYLKKFGLKKEMLFNENALVSKKHHIWGLLECLTIQEGCDDFGFHLGFEDMFVCEGPLSRSLKNQTTFYEALNATMGALSSYIQDERVEFSSENGVAHVDFVRDHSGTCQVTDQIAIKFTSLLVGMLSLDHDPISYIGLSSTEPNCASFKGVFNPEKIHFGAPLTRISIPSRVLGESVNRPALQHKELISPSGFPESMSLVDSLNAVVGDMLRNGVAPPGIVELSDYFGADRKTLYRNLVTEGSSYSSIVQDAKYQMAVDLLKNTDLPVKEVSTRLYYSNQNNFSRAFKSKSGFSPRQYRSLHRSNYDLNAGSG